MEDRLSDIEFADNPEPRCPVVLVLDTSTSMRGDAISELNEGIFLFEQLIKQDKLASLRVEVALVTFGGIVQAINLREGLGNALPDFDAETAFISAADFVAPTLQAGGGTPMGEAVTQAIALVRGRKAIYKHQGNDYYRPWILLVTDGEPTDTWQQAATMAKQEEGQKGVVVYPIGVQTANMRTLAAFSNNPPLRLQGLHFQELFQWLSKSLSAVSTSTVGTQVRLPAVDNAWGAVDTSV